MANGKEGQPSGFKENVGTAAEWIGAGGAIAGALIESGGLMFGGLILLGGGFLLKKI